METDKNKSSLDILREKPVMSGFLLMIFLTGVILIWGYFYSKVSVSWDPGHLSIFPKDNYKIASHIYDASSMTYVGAEQIKKTILEVMQDIPANYPVNKVFETLTNSYKDKPVVMGVINEPLRDSLIAKKYKEMRKAFNVQLAKLKNSRQAKKASLIKEIKQKLNSNYKLYQFSNKLTISPEIYLPYSNRFVKFPFVAGQFGHFEQNKDHQFSYKTKKANAVVTREFLKTAMVPVRVLQDANLVAAKEELDKLFKNDRAEFNAKHNEQVIKGKQDVTRFRQVAQNKFYVRWFSTMLLIGITLLMTKLLIRFIGSLLRIEVPQEITKGQLVAFIITARILRKLAVVLVVLSIVELWVDGAVVLFTGHPWVITGFMGHLNLTYALLSPICITLCTIILAWLLILNSEFGIFLNSCYQFINKKMSEPETGEKKITKTKAKPKTS